MRHLPELRKGRQWDFCGAAKCPNGLVMLMRRGLRLFLNFGGRALGQPRRRRRLRHGGRCELEQGRARNQRQPKRCRIKRCRRRGRIAASRREYHGDCRDRRGGHPAHAEYRAVGSAFGGSHVVTRKPGHRSCFRRGRAFSAGRDRKSFCPRRAKNPNLLERLFRPAREFGWPATPRAW